MFLNKDIEIMETKIVIYEDANGEIKLDVSLENDTLWLSQKQLEVLFDRDKSVISRHIKNIFKEEELDKNSTVAKNATVQKEGDREVTREIDYYNLDMIISLGYRVNSKRATSFRVWATKILKDYIINGYSINNKRLQQKGLKELNETISLLKDTISNAQIELNEAKGLLDVILNYSRTWTLLQGYDEDTLKIDFVSKEAKFILDSDEAKNYIAQLKDELIKKGEATELFGREKAGEFEGILSNIYQTFGVTSRTSAIYGISSTFNSLLPFKYLYIVCSLGTSPVAYNLGDNDWSLATNSFFEIFFSSNKKFIFSITCKKILKSILYN